MRNSNEKSKTPTQVAQPLPLPALTSMTTRKLIETVDIIDLYLGDPAYDAYLFCQGLCGALDEAIREAKSHLGMEVARDEVVEQIIEHQACKVLSELVRLLGEADTKVVIAEMQKWLEEVAKPIGEPGASESD